MIMDSLHRGLELGYPVIEQFAIYLINFSEKPRLIKGIDQTHLIMKCGSFSVFFPCVLFSQ